MNITFQLSAKKALFSRLTRWQTRGDYGHIDIITDDKPGYLLGARMLKGISYIKYNKNDYSKTRRYKLTIDHNVFNKLHFAKIGTMYDYGAILGFLTKFNIDNPNALICSEFAFAVLNDCDQIKEKIAFKGSKISPRDMRLILDTLVSVGVAQRVYEY
jgi:hypothetical protein